MHARHDKHRAVVGALAPALIDGLLRVPAVLPGQRLLGLGHQPQELDVPAREQIKPAIHIHHPLPGLRPRPAEQLLKPARGAPEQHICARLLGGLICSVQPDPLAHSLASSAALGLGARALGAGEGALERADEVALGAQQHAADEVGRRDARRALDHLEAVRRLDEAVAVLAGAVRRDVVAVDDVLAPEVADPIELGDVGRVGDGLGGPAAGVNGEEAGGWSVVCYA